MKQITLGQFLSDGEIQQALDIWKNDRPNFHKRVRDEILVPNMARINTALGQENDADYLAYAMAYIFGKIPP